jgi:hypothetical protein
MTEKCLSSISKDDFSEMNVQLWANYAQRVKNASSDKKSQTHQDKIQTHFDRCTCTLDIFQNDL